MSTRTELRCNPATLHGVLLREQGLLEFRCRNRQCGYEAGIVVLHYFDLDKAIVVDTKRFAAAEGAFGKKREVNA